MSDRCPTCHGVRTIIQDGVEEPHTCPDCGGSGRAEDSIEVNEQPTPCPTCGWKRDEVSEIDLTERRIFARKCPECLHLRPVYADEGTGDFIPPEQPTTPESDTIDRIAASLYAGVVCRRCFDKKEVRDTANEKWHRMVPCPDCHDEQPTTPEPACISGGEEYRCDRCPVDDAEHCHGLTKQLPTPEDVKAAVEATVFLVSGAKSGACDPDANKHGDAILDALSALRAHIANQAATIEELTVELGRAREDVEIVHDGAVEEIAKLTARAEAAEQRVAEMSANNKRLMFVKQDLEQRVAKLEAVLEAAAFARAEVAAGRFTAFQFEQHVCAALAAAEES